MNLYDHFAKDRTRFGATFWALFSNRRWYRRLCGGLWQKFDRSSRNRPYTFWLKVLRPFAEAIETEDYRKT